MTRSKALTITSDGTHRNRKARKRLRRALRKLAPERFAYEEKRGGNP